MNILFLSSKAGLRPLSVIGTTVEPERVANLKAPLLNGARVSVLLLDPSGNMAIAYPRSILKAPFLMDAALFLRLLRSMKIEWRQKTQILMIGM